MTVRLFGMTDMDAFRFTDTFVKSADYAALEARCRELEAALERQTRQWEGAVKSYDTVSSLATRYSEALQTIATWADAGRHDEDFEAIASRARSALETPAESGEIHPSHSMRDSREGKAFRLVCDRCGWTDYDAYSKAYLLRECTVPETEG